MARKKVDARKIVRDYTAKLPSRIKGAQAFIFGSAARRQMRKDSDVDVIVLSDAFSTIPFLQRLQLLNRHRRGPALTVPMDILGYTPEEFASFRTHGSPNV